MSRTDCTRRTLLGWLALAQLASGCQTAPVADVSISPKSSLLAVDVVFPVPLGRDPDLVQVYLVRGAIHRGTRELPELIPASFVKRSRAYLLDPEPGTYSLVAVVSAVAAPLRERPVAGGVTATTLTGTLGNATIFPAELIQRTRTSIGSGTVAFMGALRVVDGQRIDANAAFRDPLQRRIAERIRPGASSESGLSSWFTLASMPDLEQTSIRREAGDREAFLAAALVDLGDSPWARVIARSLPDDATIADSSTPAAVAQPAAAMREPASATPLPTAAHPEPAGATEQWTAIPPQSAAAMPPPAAAPEQRAAAPPPPAVARPKPSPPRSQRRRHPDVPPDSPMAQIEIGMSHGEVRRILGDPDDRIDRTTAKAWIPFYSGPDAYLRDWIYEGRGRVVFSLHGGSLEVLDVVHDPDQKCSAQSAWSGTHSCNRSAR